MEKSMRKRLAARRMLSLLLALLMALPVVPAYGEASELDLGEEALVESEAEIVQPAEDAEPEEEPAAEPEEAERELTEEGESEDAARIFSGRAGDISVRAEAESGAFPEGAELVLGEVESDSVADRAEAALGDELDIEDIAAVDISFVDEDGNKLQPADGKSVYVEISSGRKLSGDSFRLLHLPEESGFSILSEGASAGAEEIEADYVNARGAGFEANAFSIYAIVSGSSIYRQKYEFYALPDGSGSGEYELVHTRVIKSGEILYAPEMPYISDAHTFFSGWYDAEEDGNLVSFGSVITLEEDRYEAEAIKYYAHYITEYSLNLYDVDGKTILSTSTTEAGGKLRVPTVDEVPVTEGYYFIGWILKGSDRENPETIYYGGEEFTLSDGDIELEKLAEPEYTEYFTVNFDANIKDSDPTPVTGTAGEINVYHETGAESVNVNLGLTQATYTDPESGEEITYEFYRYGAYRNGYEFLGWFESAESTEGESALGNVTLTGNKTVYAHWKPYEVQFSVYVMRETLDTDGNPVENEAEKYSLIDDLSGEFSGIFREEAGSSFTAKDVYDKLSETRLASIKAAFAELTPEIAYYELNDAKNAAKYVVRGDGTTIVYIYYDLKVFDLNFLTDGGKYIDDSEKSVSGVSFTSDGTTYDGSTEALSKYTVRARLGQNLGSAIPSAVTYTGSDEALQSALFLCWRDASATADKEINLYSHKFLTEDDLYFRRSGDTVSGEADYVPLFISEAARADYYKYNMHFYFEGLDGSYAENTEKYPTIVMYHSSANPSADYSNYRIVGYTENKGEGGTSVEKVKPDDESDKEFNLNLKYDLNRYNLTFHNKDSERVFENIAWGTALKDVEGLEEYAKDPGLVGGVNYYDYMEGWYEDRESYEIGFDVENGVMPMRNLVLYANWQPKTVSVSFVDTVVHKDETLPTISVTAGEPIDLSKVPELSDESGEREFAYWFDMNFGMEVVMNEDTTFYEDTVLAARWRTQRYYHIKYSGLVGYEDPTDTALYEYGATVEFKHRGAANGDEIDETKTFRGWRLYNKDNLGNLIYYPGMTAEIDDTLLGGIHGTAEDGYQYIEFTAAYGEVAGTVDITFNSNYPAETGLEEKKVELKDKLQNENLTAPGTDDFTLEGYTFKGWSTNRGATEAMLEPGATFIADDVVSGSSEKQNSYTLYALWEGKSGIKYTVKYLGESLSEEYTYDVLLESHEYTGTAGAQFTLAAPDFEGYTAAADNVYSYTIKGDGSLVAEIKYNVRRYTVSYAYTSNTEGAPSLENAGGSYKAGASVTAFEVSEIEGYSFGKWRENTTVDPLTLSPGESFTMPARNISFVGSYTPAVLTYDYTVNHRFEPIEDEEDMSKWTLPEGSEYSYTLSGKAGDTATIYPKTFEGFNAVEESASGVITADGALVLTIHYRRDRHGISYSLEGSYTDKATAPSDEKEYKYGATVDLLAPQNVASGYHLENDSWHTDSSRADALTITPGGANEYGTITMPDRAVTIIGRIVPYTASYTVKYWQENDDEEGVYTEITAEQASGMADSGRTISAEVKVFDGFVLNEEKSEMSRTVSDEDSEIELNMYYDRLRYTLSFAWGSTTQLRKGELPESTQVRAGTRVIIDNNIAPLEETGYSFFWDVSDRDPDSGLYYRVSDHSFIMTRNVTLYGVFEGITANYTVNYYTQDLDDETKYTLYESALMSGVTGGSASYDALSIAGFTYDRPTTVAKNREAFDDESINSVSDVKIAGDGSTVIGIYYGRNSYTLNYVWSAIPNDITAEDLPDLSGLGGTYKFGASVELADKSQLEAPAGYTIADWQTARSVSGGSPLTITDNKITMPAREMNIYGSLEARTDNRYKVRHYRQNAAADGYELYDTETIEGATTGARASFSFRNFAGFSVNTDKSLEETRKANNKTAEELTALSNLTVARDGSTTVDIYYDRESFKVSFVYTENNSAAKEENLPDISQYDATLLYGGSFTLPAKPSLTGYSFSGWHFSNSSDIIFTGATNEEKESGSYNEGTGFAVTRNINVTAYFTGLAAEYKVMYYLQNADGNGYGEGYVGYSSSGVVNETITYDPTHHETPEGYEINAEKSTLSGQVKSDGSMELSVYFDRSSYGISYDITLPSVKAEADNEFPAAPTARTGEKYRYGSTVDISADNAYMSERTPEGWSFSGWSTHEASLSGNELTMDMARDVTLYGSFRAISGGSEYRVAYMGRDLEGGAFSAITDANGNAVIHEVDGATAGQRVSVRDHSEAQDGFVEITDDSGLNAEQTASESAIVRGDGQTTIYAYFERAEYTLRFGLANKPDEVNLPESRTYKYGETVDLSELTESLRVDGYGFNWNLSSLDAHTGEGGTTYYTMPASNVSVLGSYSSETAEYTVQTYLQLLNGAYAESPDRVEEYADYVGNTVSAASSDEIPGYELDSESSVLSGVVAADDSTTLVLRYKRAKYTLNYDYIGSEAGKPELTGAYLGAEYTYGEEVTLLAKLDAKTEDYECGDWFAVGGDISLNDGKIVMPARNATIYAAVYPKNNSAEVTIEYYLEGADGEYAINDELTRKSKAEIDTEVTSTPPSSGNYVFSAEKTGGANTAVVAADNSTVLKLYYERRAYGVSYSYAAGTPENAPQAPATAEYKWGRTVALAEAPEITGYSFDGWRGVLGSTLEIDDENGSFTMPTRPVNLIGSFTPSANTSYEVRYYLENLAGDGYDEAEDAREELTGRTGSQVQYTQKNFAGFEYSSAVTVAQNANTEPGEITIAGDGSTLVKLYYTRNSYTLRYSWRSVSGVAAEAMPEKPADSLHKFGETVSVDSAERTLAGYSFDGWEAASAVSGVNPVTISEGKFTMPARTVNLYGGFTANENTAYKVSHRLQNVSGDDYTLVRTEDKSGTTNTEVEASAFSGSEEGFYGFTYSGSVSAEKNGAAVNSILIAGDGSTNVGLYYTRNSYPVSYSYMGNAPQNAPEPPETKSYRHGTTGIAVESEPEAPAGYEFSGWSRPSGSDLVVTEGKFTMPIRAVVFQGSFTPKSNIAYKVYHMFPKLGAEANGNDENYDKVADGVSHSGTAGTTASADVSTLFEGFSFDLQTSEAKGKLSAPIAGDGSTELYVYYTRNSYEIRYEMRYPSQRADDDTFPAAPAPRENGKKYEYGSVVDITADDGLIAAPSGWSFNGWNVQNATLDETRDEDGNVTSRKIHIDVERDVILYGSFSAISGGSTYKEYYYARDIEGDGFSPMLEDGEAVVHSVAATAGRTVSVGSAEAKNGFSQLAYEALSEEQKARQSAVVSGTGSTALYVYFERESYTVNFELQNVPEGAEVETPASKTIRYGAEIDLSDAAPSVQGYDFSWDMSNFERSTADGETVYTMPAANGGSLTVSGSFAPADVGYYRTIYVQKTEGEGFDVESRVKRSGYTGDKAIVVSETRNGMDFSAELSHTEDVIAADGSTEIELYYLRKSYDISFVFAEGSNPASESDFPGLTEEVRTAATAALSALNTEFSESYRYGRRFDWPESIDIDGYTFSWQGVARSTDGEGATYFTVPEGNSVFRGVYTPSASVTYRVTHLAPALDWQKALSDEAAEAAGITLRKDIDEEEVYDVISSYTNSANAGSYATAVYRDFAGYNQGSGSGRHELLTGLVNGDSSTELILIYSRREYALKYVIEGTHPEEAEESMVSSENVKYGDVRYAKAAPSVAYEGYKFEGWEIPSVLTTEGSYNSSTRRFYMPDEDVTITARFSEIGGVAWYVQHWVEYLESDSTEGAERDTIDGTVYELRRTNSHEGVTNDTANAIAMDFTGFEYVVTDKTLASGTIGAHGDTVLRMYYKRKNMTLSYNYAGEQPRAGWPTEPYGNGDSVEVKYGSLVELNSESNTPSVPGYSFGGWTLRRTEAMRLNDQRQGWFQMLDDVSLSGSFLANDNKYSIKHYLQDVDDISSYELVASYERNGETDASVNAAPLAEYTGTGFYFNAEKSAAENSGSVTGDAVSGYTVSGYVTAESELVLALYYDRVKSGVTYRIINGTVPSGAKLPSSLENVPYGKMVEVDTETSAPGYEFSGWRVANGGISLKPGETSFSMPANDVVFEGSFTRSTNTAYKVVHHFEKIEGGYADEEEELSGTTGELVVFTPKQREGYVYDGERSAAAVNQTIAGDGSTVVDVYYNIAGTVYEISSFTLENGKLSVSVASNAGSDSEFDWFLAFYDENDRLLEIYSGSATVGEGIANAEAAADGYSAYRLFLTEKGTNKPLRAPYISE